MQAAIAHAREVRNRLRFPTNAKLDLGIDLKRKPAPPVLVPEEPAPVTVASDDPFGPIVHPGAVETILPTCAEIIKATAHYFDIPRIEMLSARRQAELCHARHIAMYLCKTLTLRSLPFIGRMMGDRDHTTVLSGVRNIQAKILAGNGPVIEAVDTLTAQLGGR